MPVMARVKKANAKRMANVQTMHGHVVLKRAVKKLVAASVFKKHGKPLKAKKAAKLGRMALRKAVSHYTRAAHAKAKVKTRVKAQKRRGGGGGGGILGTIIGGLGGLLGGI